MEFILLILIIFAAIIAISKSRDGDDVIEGSDHRLKHRPTHYATKQKLSEPVKRVFSGKAYVIDGDSIKIKNREFRLFGIDAPEIMHPWGKKAKWHLVSLCKGHIIEATLINTDHFNRTVAVCRLPDGTDLSEQMVRAGLALDWPKFSDGIYRHFEPPGVRKKLWSADARQKGRMYVWENYEKRKTS